MQDNLFNSDLSNSNLSDSNLINSLRKENNSSERDSKKLIKYWAENFKPCRNIKTIIKNLDLLYSYKLTYKEIEAAVYMFRDMLSDKRYFFRRLPDSFLTLDFILKTKTNVMLKNKTILKNKNISFKSSSIIFDIVQGNSYMFTEAYLIPDIINLKYNLIGSPEWEIQRVAEMVGFSYSLYCESYDRYSYNFFLGTENYIKTLNTVSKKVWKFLKNFNKDIKIYPNLPLQYFYILERPYTFTKIFIKFLEQQYTKNNLELAWIGGDVFNKLLYLFLEREGYLNFEEDDSNFNEGRYGKVKTSRREYRKIAKKTKTIFSGDVRETQRFKNFIQPNTKTCE